MSDNYPEGFRENFKLCLIYTNGRWLGRCTEDTTSALFNASIEEVGAARKISIN